MEVQYYALEKYSRAFTKWEIIRPYSMDDFDRCNREFTILNDYGDAFYRIALYTWVDDLGWSAKGIKMSTIWDIMSKNQKQ